MKAKRILAMVLSVAMVATSGNSALDVSAAGNMTDVPSAIVEEDSTLLDVTPGDVTLGDTVSEGQISKEDLSGNDVSEGNPDPQETVTTGDVTTGDVTPGDVTTGDVTTGDVTSGDTVSDGALLTGEIIDTDSAYFGIYQDGTLTLKEGVDLSELKGTLSLPRQAKKIPVGIFNNNTSITGLTIPEDSELTEIEKGAFERSGVTKLVLPEGVTEIGEATFRESKLTSITFPDTLTAIGKDAFKESKLTAVKLPASVRTIGDSAFKSCTSLSSLTMGNVETISAEAFKGCTKLTTGITWSKNLTEIGDGAFEGSGLTKAEMGSVPMEKLGKGIFAECKDLATVTLPSTMTVIPGEMFRECVKLKAPALPAACTKIEQYAFYGCDTFTSFIIPANVAVIEAYAFGGCQNLKTITIRQRADGTGDSSIVLAEEAFPRRASDDRGTMKGYDGTVEDYAAKRGYNFETLYPSYTISTEIGKNSKDHGTVTLSAKKAKPGETVEVTVKPEAGYRLKAKDFYYYLDDDLVEHPITKMVSEQTETTTTGSGASAAKVVTTTRTFRFVMPEGDTTVHVDFLSAGASYGTLSVEGFEPVGDRSVEWDSKKKVAAFDSVGTAAKLLIKSSKAENTPGSWEYTYTSGKKTVAVIDEEGVIYARGTGNATITAELKADAEKKVTFKVTVNDELEISNIELEFPGLSNAKLTKEWIDGEEIPIIQYTKDKLANTSRDFQVNVLAKAVYDDANMYVSTTWKSANSNLAYVDEETVWNNTNTVHVKKGVSGETAFTVTATNGQTDKSKKVVYGEKTFIVRVIDATPRLVQSSLKVNSQSTVGTVFDLISVYGYAADPESLRVVQDVKDKNVKEWEPLNYVTVKAENDICRLELTQEGRDALEEKGKDITYSNKAYIEGEYIYTADDGSEITDTFRTPIKSLVLTSKALKPTIKLSGKLNLFFNDSADAEDKGEVTITQSLKDLQVESYELVSEANYKQEGSEAVDSFANNFDVSDEGVISRSGNKLVTDAKNKVITKGYLKIKYEGYEPCYVKITVPVQTKKPAYVLSAAKATVNTLSSGYEIRLQILDKNKKKTPVSLGSLKSLSFDESGKGITTDLFNELDTDAARTTDTITLTIKNAQKGKAIINVEMEDWNEPMKFTFNLSVTSKVPTVKAKSSTLTLNNLCVGRETSTVFTVSQKDVALSDMKDIKFVGKAALSGEAEKIDLRFENGVLTAKADQNVLKGSYKFSMTPEVTYVDDDQTADIRPINVTVKVMESSLNMALKAKTLTLNNLFAGTEETSTTFTVKNMPAGEEVTFNSDNVRIEGSNSTSRGLEDSFTFSFGENGQIVTAEQTQKVQKATTYKFKVSGLKAVVEGREVEIQPFTISVKVINKEPKLTLKLSGTLNPCNAESSLTYVFAVSNVHAKITDVEVKELNKLGAMMELEHFEVEEISDAEGYVTSVIVKIADGETLDSKTTYKLKMGITLEGGQNTVWSSGLTVKFKQTLPKIKTDVSSATVYAGVSSDSPRRSQDIQITKTSEKTSQITTVELAKSNSDTIKKAFRVSFDEDTQTAKVTLVRPDLVKANTQYSVKLEVRMKGQLENTTGPTFTVKVKVMN